MEIDLDKIPSESAEDNNDKKEQTNKETEKDV